MRRCCNLIYPASAIVAPAFYCSSSFALLGISVKVFWRIAMLNRCVIIALTLATALAVMSFDASAFDDAKYPDLKGQWVRAEGARGVGRFDPTKPPGRLQEA